MDGDLIFYLSAKRVCEEWERDKEEKIGEIVQELKKYKEWFKKILRDGICEFDAFMEVFKKKLRHLQSGNKREEKDTKDMTDEWDLNEKDVKEWAQYHLSVYPDEWLSKLKEYSPEKLLFEFLSWKINKNKNIKVSSDDLVILFTVLAGLAEGRKLSEYIEFFKKWKDRFEELKEKMGEDVELLTRVEKFFVNKKTMEKENVEKIEKELKPLMRNIKTSITLNSLLSARERIEKNKKKSLTEYLRGSIFTGSLHFKGSYENIVVSVAHILEKMAEENVRYIEIRCSPEGYVNKEFTLHDAIHALLDGADFATLWLYTRGKYVRANFIITGKRHKSPEKLSLDIANAIVHRERMEMEYRKEIEGLQKRLPENASYPARMYKWYPSRIVGFDLAGLEKGARPSRFVEDFLPLFRTCFFITIHAGEEDTAESIWEAIYKLHAHRIGHGLTLADNPFLMELFRDLQICVEMCPISNCLTNPSAEEKYPLYDYIKQGIAVCINTDDMGFSSSTLSEEYAKAAELYWKRARAEGKEKGFPFLTRWGVLRLIKHGFKNAFLPRDEIRELLRCVEEEVYQILLEMECLEGKYHFSE
ncbi:hypothetical protein DRQ18_03750 [bacterium]|nr:MAG: hypothetical protein DRQ18_03750 [bacterium]